VLWGGERLVWTFQTGRSRGKAREALQKLTHESGEMERIADHKRGNSLKGKSEKGKSRAKVKINHGIKKTNTKGRRKWIAGGK